MFQDEDTREFMLYTVLTGILIILLACVTLMCMVPGNEDMCKIPFLADEEDSAPSYIYNDPPEFALKEGVDYEAVIVTDYGDIRVNLFEENAPNTVNNFVFLAQEGYYDGIKVHRVFQDLLIQTGSRKSINEDPTDDGFGGPGYTIEDEVNWDSLDVPEKQREKLEELGYISVPDLASMTLKEYVMAMANEHKGNTNGSQFFIVTADDSDTRLKALQGRHTVFGEVIDGFEVVDEINEVRVNDDDENAPYPKKDIYVEAIVILEIQDGTVEIDGQRQGEVSRDQTVIFGDDLEEKDSANMSATPIVTIEDERTVTLAPSATEKSNPTSSPTPKVTPEED